MNYKNFPPIKSNTVKIKTISILLIKYINSDLDILLPERDHSQEV